MINARISRDPLVKDNNIVKLAVQMTGQTPQLKEFNQKLPLTTIIQELCNYWGITDPEQYSLQFSHDDPNETPKYITEQNRHEIKHGSVLLLSPTPERVTRSVLDRFDGTNEDKLKALQELSKISSDLTFATVFISADGLNILVTAIEKGKFIGDLLVYSLASFVDLMDHGVVPWDLLQPPFISKIISIVNNQSQAPEPRTLQAALSILENLIQNSTVKYSQVEKELTIPNLTNHLQRSDKITQQNAVAVLNAILMKAEDSKRKVIAATLNTRLIRNSILTNIIQASGGKMGSEMAHQLHVLQSLMLGLHEDRMNKPMDPADQESLEKIKELRKIAFDNDTGDVAKNDMTARRTVSARDFKKLGFKNDTNPALDFAESPPGLLALDVMIYFARNHMDKYTKVVLENACRDEYECPFGRTAIELTKLLCDILKIGEPPSEQGTSFHPMFFSHDHPFEEFFCHCLLLVNKTWKEMRATVEDFTKVFSVVREQITRALGSSPHTLEAFKAKLATLTYAEINNLWQQERNTREEWESHSRPIVQLREQITPEITELIQQQRLNFLVEGTRFNKYSSRGRIKDKFWYARLSPNHRILHYGDCDEKSVPTLEELAHKIPIVDVKALVTGKDCPHMKDARGKKPTSQFAFSLLLDSSEMGSLDFIAADEQTYSYWLDGINTLLGYAMTSKEAASDLEILLGMETKLRLLDIEGIDLPDEPPPIPPEPSNFDFALESR